jgi:4a-hydroxytetrahydrobiopterin dehydratase
MAYDRTRLTDEEVQAFLKDAPEWKRTGDAITRTYTFKTFPDAIGFVVRVAHVAEKNDHHPDIDIRWNKVTLLLTTHDAGGLTFRDPKVARECDALLG